ncbi:MAG: tetratricopeptide repeat protein [Planctomycetota bacterium]
MKLHRLLVATFAAASVASVHAQDIIGLKDGRFFEVSKIERAEAGYSMHFQNGTILVPEALVLDVVLSNEPAPPPATPDEEQKLAEGQVRYDGKWVTLKRRDDLVQKKLEGKRKELEEARAAKEWINRKQHDTSHFHFEYTVPQHIFEEYRDTMEAYFQAFAKFWKIKTPGKSDRLKVCLHANIQTYMQVTGNSANVLGTFRYVRPWELNIYYDRRDPDLSIEVMFHEANHYLQKLIDLGFAYPHFPGESVAEYYGASHWDSEARKLSMGLILEGRVVQIQDDVASGKRMELSKLLSTDSMFEHYTWGWSLVHFLMNDERYKEKFPKFMVALAKGKDVDRINIVVDNLQSMKGEEVLKVFMREIGIKDAIALRKLENEWHEYVDTNIKIESVDGKAQAGVDAARNNRPLRAMRLLGEAIDGGSRRTTAYLLRSQLIFARGKTEEAVSHLRKALEIDPLDGEIYGVLGYVLRQSKDTEDEGRRLEKLAKELGYEQSVRISKIKDKEKDEDDEGGDGDGD